MFASVTTFSNTVFEVPAVRSHWVFDQPFLAHLHHTAHSLVLLLMLPHCHLLASTVVFGLRVSGHLMLRLVLPQASASRDRSCKPIRDRVRRC